MSTTSNHSSTPPPLASPVPAKSQDLFSPHLTFIHFKNTMVFLMTQAYLHLFRNRLNIDHSFCDGYYAEDTSGIDISDAMIDSLIKKIHDWIVDDTCRLSSTSVIRNDLINYFLSMNMDDKVANMRNWMADPTPVIHLQCRDGAFVDYRFQQFCVDKSKFLKYQIIKYSHGLLIRFANIPWRSDEAFPAFFDKPRLFKAIRDNESWGRKLRCSFIKDLNDHVYSKDMKEIVWVAEARICRQLSHVAEGIIHHFRQKRIVFIAGPSSSGKTTTAKRLAIELRSLGHTTVTIGFDDYYKNRNDTTLPLNANGDPNYEVLGALHVDLLAEKLLRLVKGERVSRRVYDFKTKQGMESDSEFYKLQKQDVIVVEGIHGLNSEWINLVGAQNVTSIFVSPITCINIDTEWHVSTSDNRLLRRTIRDYRFRNYSPEHTLKKWREVRAGEEEFIFPYQENADYVINTSLIYELNVLTTYCTPLLSHIEGTSSIDVESEAFRLRNLLRFFFPFPEEGIPDTSILREFVGKSAFDYE